MHLVGFIIRIRHDARSPERQKNYFVELKFLYYLRHACLLQRLIDLLFSTTPLLFRRLYNKRRRIFLFYLGSRENVSVAWHLD